VYYLSYSNDNDLDPASTKSAAMADDIKAAEGSNPPPPPPN
jgi:hypothetical protein